MWLPDKHPKLLTAKKSLTLSSLLLNVAFVVFFIYGAFLGEQRAQKFLLSGLPALLWCALITWLIVAILLGFLLKYSITLYIVFIGVLLVLIGSTLNFDLVDQATSVNGIINISKGESQRQVYTENGDVIELPFILKLVNNNRSNLNGKTIKPSNSGNMLRLIVDGENTKECRVKLNHPLVFGGYYIYHHSYDERDGSYNFQVKLNKGIPFVFWGYCLVVLGLFTYFWTKPSNDNLAV